MQIEVCKDKLTSLGVKVRRLETPDILLMLHQQIANNKEKEFNKEEIKDLAHFMFAPDKVNFLADHFKVDDKFCKVIAVTGYYARYFAFYGLLQKCGIKDKIQPKN